MRMGCGTSRWLFALSTTDKKKSSIREKGTKAKMRTLKVASAGRGPPPPFRGKWQKSSPRFNALTRQSGETNQGERNIERSEKGNDINCDQYRYQNRGGIETKEPHDRRTATNIWDGPIRKFVRLSIPEKNFASVTQKTGRSRNVARSL